MSSTGLSEWSQYSPQGAEFYIPATQVAGTEPLYRLYASNIQDHMDSTTSSVAGYSEDAILGYPYTSATAVPGLSEIVRLFDSTTNDHATVQEGESLPGYGSPEGFGVYGYPRYLGNRTDLLSLSAGGVTISSNEAAGGALWGWTYDGTDFVNTSDFGREIQSSILYHSSDGSTPTTLNPTEAGDEYSGNTANQYDLHGSPLISASNIGSTQNTMAVPVDYPQLGNGMEPDFVFAYPDLEIGKSVTLNYDDMGPVAEYDTVTNILNQAISGNVAQEIPTAYLPSTFDDIFTYDPAIASSPATNVTNSVPNCPTSSVYDFTPSTGNGGIIASEGSSSTSTAFGIYEPYIGLTGSNGYQAVLNASTWLTPCETGNPDETVKISAAVTTIDGYPVGTCNFNSFLMSGTLASVESDMQQLYADGTVPEPGCVSS